MNTFDIFDAMAVKEFCSKLMPGVSVFYKISTKEFVFISGAVGLKIKYLHELQNIFTVILHRKLNTHTFWFKYMQQKTESKEDNNNQ
jgi:hypothetical protein